MTQSVSAEALDILKRLGVPASAFAKGGWPARSPITGEVIVELKSHSASDATAAIGRADAAFKEWRKIPAPRRGELVRLLGEELRAAKDDLGRLVTLEVGKVTSEGLGEVQEMIDICDYAVGLSRQLFGLTIATERPSHRMMETWHPLGVCGVISAFNFPVAVWSWNAALAFVCGDSVVWKPSEKAVLTALATQAILKRAADRFGGVPDGLLEVLVGGREVGDDEREQHIGPADVQVPGDFPVGLDPRPEQQGHEAIHAPGRDRGPGIVRHIMDGPEGDDAPAIPAGLRRREQHRGKTIIPAAAETERQAHQQQETRDKAQQHVPDEQLAARLGQQRERQRGPHAEREGPMENPDGPIPDQNLWCIRGRVHVLSIAGNYRRRRIIFQDY